MSHKARFAPKAASLMLVASPMPLEAPVITITVSCKGRVMIHVMYEATAQACKWRL